MNILELREMIEEQLKAKSAESLLRIAINSSTLLYYVREEVEGVKELLHSVSNLEERLGENDE